MEISKFWRFRLALLKFRHRLNFLPRSPISLRQIIFRLRHLAPDNSYFHWRAQNVPRPVDLQKLAETVELLPHKPLISVIMPVCDTPELFVRESIVSVIAQIYPNWELWIVNDASTEPHIRELLGSYQAQDRRIKAIFLATNDRPANRFNSALKLATGEFIALLDCQDLLTPDALYEVALLVNRHPEADMIYSDEDKVDDRGKFKDPFFKPDWCPDSFLSRMYTSNLGVYRRTQIEVIGGFRPSFAESQVYDFVLRFTEQTDRILHIAKILYHRRSDSNSNFTQLDRANFARNNVKKAVEAALQRRGEVGRVMPIDLCPNYHLIRYQIREFNLVTIIIPTKDLGAVLDRCLTSIFEKTTYPNYEVLVVDNGSTDQLTFAIFDDWLDREPTRFRSQVLDIPFNYSTLNNYAVEQSQGDYLLFLNNDTEVITADWLDAMVEQVQRPQIGAVGVRLLYPDGTLQHAGVTAGIAGIAGHSHKHFPGNALGYFAQIQTINNYSAVTAACLMCRRDVFLQVGGFEEDLPVALNDIDLCFKMLAQGYRNIYLPHVPLYHYESKSRGYEDTPEKQARFSREVLYIQNKWYSIIANDPCYNPNLTRTREDYSLNL